MKEHRKTWWTLATSGLATLAFVATIYPNASAQQAAPAARQQPPAAPGGGRGATPGTEFGWATFQTRCSSCHRNPPVGKAQTPDAIRAMSPERIYDALTKGTSHPQTADLSNVQKKGVAEFMAGRPLGSSKAGAASAMVGHCTANPPMADPASDVSWNGWGNGVANTRFQSAGAAGLTAAQVPQLKLKWAFAFPAGVTANAQPSIVSGRVFVGSDNGYLYSLDAKTGCLYWAYEAGSIIRPATVIGAISGHGNAKYAVFVGDGQANVHAVDAQTGRLLWKTEADPHFIARITGGSTYYNGKLFVPVSSSEEFSSGNPDYPCCTSRGSVVALDANTGKQLWKAWTVPEEPKPWKTMPNGVTLYKPAGGAVWNAPTVDPVRGAVIFGTGDATTAPPAVTTDAIMAVDINTGKTLWHYQATENDVFMGGCTGANKSEACPNPMGPDMDIGNSPILVTLPGGKRAVLAGTKSADVFGLDPDNNGKLLFRVNPAGQEINGTRFGRGTIVWGGASDGQRVYYGMAGAGLAAVNPADGKTAWVFTAPQKANGGRAGGLGAAPTAMPGVVFEGGGDGMLYALSSSDGKLLWSFDTSQEFETVNRMLAHGGAISVSGAVPVKGMVFIGSGYAISSGASGGNVLLAFGVD